MAADEVHRYPPNNISVLIVGAGVGGLLAALECWRKGCNVQILERTGGPLKTGDSFTVGQAAIQIFQHWQYLRERNEQISYDPLLAYHRIDGERTAGPMELKALMSESAKEAKVWRHSRPRFHAMLLEQLKLIEVKVEYGKEAVRYDEDMERGCARVVLKDGSCHEADLVIAADGVRGQSWPLIAGKPIPARSSGDAMYRVAYPIELALADPVVAERWPLRQDGRSVVELWLGDGMHAFFWRNEHEMHWLIQHPDHGSAEESWGHRVTPDRVLEYTKTIPSWPEVAKRLIQTMPADCIVDWKLMWRDPQPTWTSPGGRVVQLGDAAHSFLPSSGNGATQAIEDAISLATCLAIAGSKNAIPDATPVHNLLRFERVSCLQAFGVVNRQKHNNSSTVSRRTGGKRDKIHVGKWMPEHDPAQYARDNYDAALAHIIHGRSFHNTNTPPGLVHKPWRINGLLEAEEKGEPTVLDDDWD